MDFWWTILGVLVIAGAFTLWRASVRRKALLAKYGDAKIVSMILRRDIWQGMTSEHLVDSRGRPSAIDEKVYKSKVVHTYKYEPDGKKRFRTRITVENGHVVGWSQR